MTKLNEYLDQVEERVEYSCTIDTVEVAFRKDVEVLLEIVKKQNKMILVYHREFLKYEQTNSILREIENIEEPDIVQMSFSDLEDLIPKGDE